MSREVRISALDSLFSNFIRTRDKWTCQRCERRFDSTNKFHRMALHNAHCVAGRGKHSTRFDEENCHALCYGCHSYLDSHPREMDAWFVGKYGQACWDAVHQRSHQIKQWRTAEKLALKLRLKSFRR